MELLRVPSSRSGCWHKLSFFGIASPMIVYIMVTLESGRGAYVVLRLNGVEIQPGDKLGCTAGGSEVVEAHRP